MSNPSVSDAGTADTRQILIALWKEVLSADDIHPDSDFFQLGGDSLQMMTLLFRIAQETGIEIDPGSVFENPTLEQLAQFIANAQLSPDGGEGTF